MIRSGTERQCWRGAAQVDELYGAHVVCAPCLQTSTRQDGAEQIHAQAPLNDDRMLPLGPRKSAGACSRMTA